jgi:hypothetical protein
MSVVCFFDFKWFHMVFFVLNAIPILVFLNDFVINRISGPKFVKVVHLSSFVFVMLREFWGRVCNTPQFRGLHMVGTHVTVAKTFGPTFGQVWRTSFKYCTIT